MSKNKSEQTKDPDKNENSDDVPMPLTSHLGELRKRLVRIIIVILVVFVGTTVVEMELDQQILSAFGFDKDMETFDVETIVQGLTTELSSLNALNAKAPEAYLEVSYGYRSMSARKNSLEEERTGIVKFIESIERDKLQTFLDAFDKVDKEIRLIFNTI